MRALATVFTAGGLLMLWMLTFQAFGDVRGVALPLESPIVKPALPLTSEGSHRIFLDGWRGERVQSLLLLVADTDCRSIEFKSQPFAGTIPLTVVPLTPTVIYGMTHWDRVGSDTQISLGIGEMRPFLLTLEIPREHAHGTFNDTLYLSIDGKMPTLNFPIRLEISQHTLNAPEDFYFSVDLPLYPVSDEVRHRLPLATLGKPMVSTVITPVDGISAQVVWQRSATGGMRYDFSALDTWLTAIHDSYPRSEISLYGLLPRIPRFRYIENDTEKILTLNPNAPEYALYMRPFLNSLRHHIENKPWKNRIRFVLNEGHGRQARNAVEKLIRELFPEGIIESPEIRSDGLTVYRRSNTRSPREGHLALSTPPKDHGALAALSPNAFSRGIYLAYALGLNGFRSRLPAIADMDTAPAWFGAEGESTIRFERLRQALENIEKLHQLRERFRKRPIAEARADFEVLDKTLGELILKPDAIEIIGRIRELTKEISRKIIP